VLVETADWKKDFHRWFDRDDLLEVPLVSAASVPAADRRYFPETSGSPTEIPKVPQTADCAIQEKVSALAIEFTTTCPGVPHWISMAYHPNWRVDGASGVYLASPAFMMVVPEGPTVRLRFARSVGDWAGVLGTLAGIGFAFAISRRRALVGRSLSPAAARRVEHTGLAIVAVSMLVVGVSLSRTIGSQIFAWRGWHAFQAEDFPRARREYERGLWFGRHHASSPDALFYRATSLFRMNEHADAIRAYDDLLASAPESVYAAESAYQIGICQQRLGQAAPAIAAFRRAAAEYESSRWARLAADRLRELGAAPPTGSPR
jgi:hypothetical protein